MKRGAANCLADNRCSAVRCALAVRDPAAVTKAVPPTIPAAVVAPKSGVKAAMEGIVAGWPSV